MTAGILGGGQLALMLGEALDRLGQEVLVLEEDVESPCAQRRSGVVRLRYADFFSRVDFATFDSENIDAGPLAPFAGQLKPSLQVLEVTQHRAREKEFLRAHGFPTVKFAVVPPGTDVHAAARAFGFPFIAKSVLGGYDGKGQRRVEDEDELSSLPPDAPGGWVLEEALSLECELSCIVARTAQQQVSFPVFENRHANHLLDFTVLPARVEQRLQDEVTGVASRIADALELEGLLTVEFFVGAGRDGGRRVFVNELAPRVHNSGHVTRQACNISQFDALARVLAGVPLVQPRVHRGAWCMGQLTGEVWLAQGRSGGALDLSAWAGFPDVVDVYVYGKREARRGRKMGHFVVHAETPERALERAELFRDELMKARGQSK